MQKTKDREGLWDAAVDLIDCLWNQQEVLRWAEYEQNDNWAYFKTSLKLNKIGHLLNDPLTTTPKYAEADFFSA